MPHAALLSIVVAGVPALEAARKPVLVVGKPLCPIMVSPAVACVGVALVDCICAMLMRDSRRQADHTFKVGVVGAGNVGKSAFVTRLGGEEFVSTYSRATTGTVPCTHTGVAVGGPYESEATFVVRTSAGSVRVEMVEVSRREEDEGGIADDDDLYVGTSARYVLSWLLFTPRVLPSVGLDGVFVLFDCTARITYKQVPAFYRDVVRVLHAQPVILLGNKCDIIERMYVAAACACVCLLVCVVRRGVTCGVSFRRVRPKHIAFHRRKNLSYYDIAVKTDLGLAVAIRCMLRARTGSVGHAQSIAVSAPKLTLVARRLLLQRPRAGVARTRWHAVCGPR